MSDFLAHLPQNLPDLAERGAYGTLLLLVLAVGFVLAWFIQAARRQRVVRRIIETHTQEELAQQEETRLLAEDLALEQANRLAQQARSIAHLKARLATHIARERGETATSADNTRTGVRPATAQTTNREGHRPARTQAPDSKAVLSTTPQAPDSIRFPATLILQQAEAETRTQAQTLARTPSGVRPQVLNSSRLQTRTLTSAPSRTGAFASTRPLQTITAPTQPAATSDAHPMPSPAPTTRPIRLQHTRTGSVITTAELARRAAARASAIQAAAAERARTAPHPAPHDNADTNADTTADPAREPTDAPRPPGSTCVDMATQAALVASRASRLHNAAQVSRAGYTLYDATRAARNEMSLAIAGFELEALKKRLAHELRNSRERARLMRQYENDAEHWHQAHQQAQERCVSLAGTVRALETVLQQTRHSWAASESELAQLREQLRQQQAINLMNVRPPAGPAAPLPSGKGSGNDHPPLSMLLRERLNQAARSLGRRDGMAGGGATGPQ